MRISIEIHFDVQPENELLEFTRKAESMIRNSLIMQVKHLLSPVEGNWHGKEINSSPLKVPGCAVKVYNVGPATVEEIER